MISDRIARIGAALYLATVTTMAHSGSLSSAISVDDVAKFAGKSAIVCADLVRTSGVTGVAQKAPILLAVGAPAPNARLTIRIPESSRSKFSPWFESRMSGRQVCVDGKINAPRESPGHFVIDVNDPSQFKFIGAPLIADADYAAARS